jgi:hypothetical protein
MSEEGAAVATTATEGGEAAAIPASLDQGQGGQQDPGSQDSGNQGSNEGSENQDPVSSSANSEGSQASDQGGESGNGADSSGGGAGEGVGSPAEYAKFEMPEGTNIDQAALDKALPMFRDLNLNQDGAQQLVNFYTEMVSGERIQNLVKDAQTSFTKARAEGWAEALKNDQEIGGEKYSENAKYANKAIEAFATPEFVSFLKSQGLGVHPEVVRYLSKVGRAMAEDNFAGGKSDGAGGDGQKKDRIGLLYG